nr:hypothetical protein [Fodinicola feengrottensis]
MPGALMLDASTTRDTPCSAACASTVNVDTTLLLNTRRGVPSVGWGSAARCTTASQSWTAAPTAASSVASTATDPARSSVRTVSPWPTRWRTAA